MDKKELIKVKKRQDDRVKKALIDRGIIIVNTGDGKGKSSAAFGTAFRAVGQGLTVAIIQFIKGKWKTGEMEIFKNFDQITHIISGDGFTWNTQDPEADKVSALRGWDKAKEIILGRADRAYQLLILDEFNLALKYGFVDIDEVAEILKNKPDELNIIITGRDAPKKIIEVADTVTDMTPVKHAFDRGIKAQRGIEF